MRDLSKVRPAPEDPEPYVKKCKASLPYGPNVALHRRWLLLSHVGHHELPELELSRAWELVASSKAF